MAQSQPEYPCVQVHEYAIGGVWLGGLDSGGLGGLGSGGLGGGGLGGSVFKNYFLLIFF